jgi:integrase
MTRIRSIDPADLVYEWRKKSLPTLGNYSELAAKPWDELDQYEIFEGCRLGDKRLIMPEDWVPPNSVRRLSKRTISPSDAGVPTDPDAAKARDQAIRRTLLALWLPRMTKTGVREYKPSPWISRASLLLRLAKWQFDNLPTDDGSVFGGFTVTNILQHVFPDLAPKERGRKDLRALFRTLVDAGIRGVISDWPRLYADDETCSDNAPTIERNRHGRTAPAPVEKAEQRNWQPFSDSFVTEFIRRTLWVHANLADQLVPLWAELREITAKATAQGRLTYHPSVIESRNAAIERVQWVDSAGKPITKLPFEIACRDGISNRWPPTTASDLNRMVTTLQAMNFGIIDFCTGARVSELQAAEDTEDLGFDSRLRSVTFKLIDQIGGQARDWPLHPAAVRAIQVQQKICRIVRPSGQTHLWIIQRGDGNKLGKRLLNLTEPFVQAVHHLGLSGLTGRDRAHVHRWRHTVARLVALSVVGAPQVLLDLFGHRDLEMTLRYMLSDPRIIEETMKVAKEISYASAAEAIGETIEGKTGGPAAAPLGARLAAAGLRRGEDVFKTSTLRETVEILTFNGRYWSLVRPGVICTKGLGQYGPCTKERGAPDPGACRTTCDHRLETSRAKQDCEETLRMLIIERDQPASDGNGMLLANLDGQILANLKRWEDVRARVLKDHPNIQNIWEAGQ